MSLTKSKGNMYEWVTHTHSHLLGKCPHGCHYCYVQAMAKRFPVMKERYSGELRLDPKSLRVDYGEDKTIFIDHLNDLFAAAVLPEFIDLVVGHCAAFPKNAYVFQSKNPGKMNEYVMPLRNRVKGLILGTTIESNRWHECMGNSLSPFRRTIGIEKCRHNFETFITIEPILDFDLKEFCEMLRFARPDFINIGADSKGHGLDEPSYDKIMALVEDMNYAGIEIRKKVNLDRLKGREA